MQSPFGIDFQAFGILQRQHPQLHRACRDVVFPDDSVYVRQVCARIETIIGKIRKLYSFSRGCGVAAPQIGEPLRLTGIIMPDEVSVRFLINPRIISCSERKILDYEGCLSFWGYRGRVWRPESLTVTYREPDGVERTLDMTGNLARLMCHEIDHMDGILYDNHIKEPEKLIGLEEYQALRSTAKLPLPEYSVTI